MSNATNKSNWKYHTYKRAQELYDKYVKNSPAELQDHAPQEYMQHQEFSSRLDGDSQVGEDSDGKPLINLLEGNFMRPLGEKRPRDV
jgi:hypothetical protein